MRRFEESSDVTVFLEKTVLNCCDTEKGRLKTLRQVVHMRCMGDGVVFPLKEQGACIS